MLIRLTYIRKFYIVELVAIVTVNRVINLLKMKLKTFLRRSVRFFDQYILDPVLNASEKYIRRMGACFVVFLVSLMFLITLIVYLVVFPYEFVRRGFFNMSLVLLIGHYLLIHVISYYVAACKTDPGKVPIDGYV